MYTRNSCDYSVFIGAECLILNDTVTPGLEDTIWSPRMIFSRRGTSAVVIDSPIRSVLAIEATRRLLLRKHLIDPTHLEQKSYDSLIVDWELIQSDRDDHHNFENSCEQRATSIRSCLWATFLSKYSTWPLQCRLQIISSD